MVARVVETGLPLVYLNLIGGQDDQIFDGGSFALNPGGAAGRADAVLRRAHPDHRRRAHRRRLADRTLRPCAGAGALGAGLPRHGRGHPGLCAEIGLLQGPAGAFGRHRFSAIVATVAADALGPENVRCVRLPSKYSSEGSLTDAEDLANRLGCQLPDHARSRTGCRPSKTRSRRSSTGLAPGHHRGEPAIAPARALPHGDVQQVRRTAADHRQQVRDRGRLLHDLWRHERGLQPDQGPLQDPRFRMLPLAQCRNITHG